MTTLKNDTTNIGLSLVLTTWILPNLASAQQFTVAVVAVPVVKQEVASGQTFVGTVKPTKHAVIGSAVDGRVVQLLVDEGDRVKSGQPLAKLLTETIQLELQAAKAELRLRNVELEELENGSRPEEIAQAKAQMLRAIARMEYAKKQRDRAVRLFNDKATSEAEHAEALAEAAAAEQTVEESKATFELVQKGPRKGKIAQASARVDVQKALVNQLQDRIKKHTLISRFDGYITAEHAEEGAWVKTGDPVVEVAALDQVEVEAYVIAQHVPHVEVGSTVRVEVPALANRLLEGKVIRIVPQADLRARTFPVKVRVDNVLEQSGPLLKSGMYTRVTLPVGPKQQATLVPKDAIVLGGRQPTVFVVDMDDKEDGEGKARPVPVELGIAVGNLIQVAGALEEGQLVVVEGNERLQPEQDVKLVQTKNNEPRLASEKAK